MTHVFLIENPQSYAFLFIFKSLSMSLQEHCHNDGLDSVCIFLMNVEQSDDKIVFGEAF